MMAYTTAWSLTPNQARMHVQAKCIQRYTQSQKTHILSETPATHFASWRDGDIAFLKHHTEFDELDYQSLIDSGYLPFGATEHPVIILSRPSADSTHVVITPVSSYGSDLVTNGTHLPPWCQEKHWRKNPELFRSFQGTPRYNNRKQLLQLKDGKMMPKRNASWVFIRSVWVVPVTTLKNFDKTPTKLCMTKESLDDLLAHMRATTRWLGSIMNDARLKLKFKPTIFIKTQGPTVKPVASSPASSPINVHRTIARPAIAIGSSVARTQVATATNSSQPAAWISKNVPQPCANIPATTSYSKALQTPWRQPINPPPIASCTWRMPSPASSTGTGHHIHDPWSSFLRPIGPVLVSA